MKAKHADTAIIRHIIENPKRPGSMAHDRYELYRDGMRVRQFLDAGGSRRDLCWDEKRGHVVIT